MGKANKAVSGVQSKTNEAKLVQQRKTNEGEAVVQQKTNEAKPVVQRKTNKAKAAVQQKTNEGESEVPQKTNEGEAVVPTKAQARTYDVLETFDRLISFQVSLEWPDCLRTLEEEESKTLGSDGKSVWEGPAHKKLAGTVRQYQLSQEDWDRASETRVEILALKANRKNRGGLHLPDDEIKRKFACTKEIMYFQSLSGETFSARVKRLLVKILNVLSKKELNSYFKQQ